MIDNTSNLKKTLATGGDASKAVSLIRLDTPPVDTLLASEYNEWGMCSTCGIHCYEVFVRREGTIGNSKVKLPVTIPGKIQLGRCLKCKPRKSKRGKKGSGDDNADEATEKSLFPDLLDAPAAAADPTNGLDVDALAPYAMVRAVSHISHISNGETSATSSEPSHESHLSWSDESEVSEDSILRRVVSFAALNDTQGSGSSPKNSKPTAATIKTAKYKKRTEEDDSIGTSIATSLASTSDSENDSNSDDSDDDTVVSGNKTSGDEDKPNTKKNEIDASILKLDQPIGLPTRRAQSSPGKLAREWRRIDLDDDTFLYSTSSSHSSGASSSNNMIGGAAKTTTSRPAKTTTSRPKWTARTAIMTHEEELQAMITEVMKHHNEHADISEDQSVDSTSGDPICMAARLRKEYGVNKLNFPSAASVGSSGKGSSLLSGTTTSTAACNSELSSGWVSQSREADKKTWNKKILGYFSADKILGRHRNSSNHKGYC